jgi:transcriptional regulator
VAKFEPGERRETIRAALQKALLDEPLTALEISTRVGISEKEVAEHLEHLRKSLKARGQKLEVTPAECVACGFSFATRTRLTKPGRCPECSAERVSPPMFRVVTL